MTSVKTIELGDKTESKIEFDTKTTESVKSDFVSILSEEPIKVETKKDVVESIGIDLENNVYLQVKVFSAEILILVNKAKFLYPKRKGLVLICLKLYLKMMKKMKLRKRKW